MARVLLSLLTNKALEKSTWGVIKITSSTVWSHQLTV